MRSRHPSNRFSNLLPITAELRWLCCRSDDEAKAGITREPYVIPIDQTAHLNKVLTGLKWREFDLGYFIPKRSDPIQKEKDTLSPFMIVFQKFPFVRD
jgi:hypothetical protein